MAKRKRTAARIEEIRPSTWDKERLHQLLVRGSGKRILVIGDVGIDRYTIGSVERISPEAPVPIVLVEDERLKLGLAANVADNVKALGAIPKLVGVVGRDRGAQDFRNLLRSSGIQATHLVEDRARRTVLKERVVSERQQLLRVDYETQAAVAKPIEARILSAVRKLIRQVDAVILEDYAKGMLSAGLARQIFAMARSHGKIVAVDPNAKTPVGVYRGASVLTPNTKEAEKLSGMAIRDETSLCRAGFALLELARAENVVITRGKDGMAIFSARNPVVRLIPTYTREVYDVSGAGDTVITVLAISLAAGASVEDACILGNLAAGVEVGKRGTATVTPEEIRVAMEFHSG